MYKELASLFIDPIYLEIVLKLRLCPYCTGWFYVVPQNAIWHRMNRNGLWHKSLTTRRTSCRSGWPRGFGQLNSSLHPWIFTSVPVGFRPRSCLFTSATGRISVHTAPKYATKPIRFVTLHFRDRHGAASLRHRNRNSCVWTEALSDITVFVATQKVSGMVWTKGHLLRASVGGWRWGKKKIEFFSFRTRFPCILAEFVEKTEHRTGRFANLENKNYLRVHVN